MPLTGLEPTILVSERPQTHALDRAATGIGPSVIYRIKFRRCAINRHNRSAKFDLGMALSVSIRAFYLQDALHLQKRGF
jgi:hypothetical protein